MFSHSLIWPNILKFSSLAKLCGREERYWEKAALLPPPRMWKGIKCVNTWPRTENGIFIYQGTRDGDTGSHHNTCMESDIGRCRCWHSVSPQRMCGVPGSRSAGWSPSYWIINTVIRTHKVNMDQKRKGWHQHTFSILTFICPLKVELDPQRKLIIFNYEPNS